MPSRPRIMVTGGAGFLGAHLCERLLERGGDVVCVDNFVTGRRRNVDRLLGSDRFKLIAHDVCVPIAAEVDAIYNLACPASPVRYQSDPVATLRTSVFGAANLLELARIGRAKILQASTSEVYGDPSAHPQAETYWGNVNPVGPRACYDEGKRCAETLFSDYRRQYGVRAKIVRIFNTYGPGMRVDDGRVVSNFVVQALRGQDITIYGDGSQTRAFCYRDDVIEALIAMMDGPDDFMGPVNVGDPRELTVLELARIIVDLAGSSSRIVFRPLPVDDPRRRRPDIALAEARLGWRPRTDLAEGLRRTIASFEHALSVETASAES